MIIFREKPFFSLCLLCLCSLAGCGKKSYDLRFQVEAKEIYRSETVLDLENSRVQISQGAESTPGRMSFYQKETREMDIYAVKNGQPTVLKLTYLENWQSSQIQMDEGEPEVTEEVLPLQARSLLWKKSGDTWTSELVGSKPTPAQSEAIQNLDDPWTVDFVPAHAISVGHSWVVTGEALKRIAGTEATNLNGKLKAHFEQVIERDGVLCAMIAVQFDISGQVPLESGQPMPFTLSGEGHIYRSLAEKFDRESSLSGTMTIQAVEIIPGKSNFRMRSEGPFTISETTTKNSY